MSRADRIVYRALQGLLMLAAGGAFLLLVAVTIDGVMSP